MKLLKSFLLSSALLTCFSLPVKANSQECLNSQLRKGDMSFFQFERAEEFASITYEGNQWIWYSLSEPDGGHQSVDTIIITNEQGVCELKLFDPAASLTTKEDFESYLGAEVYKQFRQSFRD